MSGRAEPRGGLVGGRAAGRGVPAAILRLWVLTASGPEGALGKRLKLAATPMPRGRAPGLPHPGHDTFKNDKCREEVTSSFPLCQPSPPPVKDPLHGQGAWGPGHAAPPPSIGTLLVLQWTPPGSLLGLGSVERCFHTPGTSRAGPAAHTRPGRRHVVPSSTCGWENRGFNRSTGLPSGASAA